jgi:hypothetical protein
MPDTEEPPDAYREYVDRRRKAEQLALAHAAVQPPRRRLLGILSCDSDGCPRPARARLLRRRPRRRDGLAWDRVAPLDEGLGRLVLHGCVPGAAAGPRPHPWRSALARPRAALAPPPRAPTPRAKEPQFDGSPGPMRKWVADSDEVATERRAPNAVGDEPERATLSDVPWPKDARVCRAVDDRNQDSARASPRLGGLAHARSVRLSPACTASPRADAVPPHRRITRLRRRARSGRRVRRPGRGRARPASERGA